MTVYDSLGVFLMVGLKYRVDMIPKSHFKTTIFHKTSKCKEPH